MGMYEIDMIVRGVAKRVLTDLDKEVPKDVMKKRGEALKIMGEMFKKVGQEGKKFEKHPITNLDLDKKAGEDKSGEGEPSGTRGSRKREGEREKG